MDSQMKETHYLGRAVKGGLSEEVTFEKKKKEWIEEQTSIAHYQIHWGPNSNDI